MCYNVECGQTQKQIRKKIELQMLLKPENLTFKSTKTGFDPVGVQKRRTTQMTTAI